MILCKPYFIQLPVQKNVFYDISISFKTITSVFTKDHTIMAIFIPMILTLGLIISVVQGQIPEYYDGNRILATKGALPSGGISWVETSKTYSTIYVCLIINH